MKNSWKCTFAALLMLLVLWILPAHAEAAELSGNYWTFSNGVLTITGNSPNYHLASSSSSYMIGTPFEVNGIQSQVTEIIVQEGVTSLGNLTFYDLSNATKLSLPSTLVTIGSDTFMNCSSLTEVTIPASVTSIKCGAFRNCSAISSITFKGKPPAMSSTSAFFDGYDGLFAFNVSEAQVYYPPYNAWTAGQISDYSQRCVGMTWHMDYEWTGSGGENVTWYLLADGTMVLRGSGDLVSYTHSGAPWAQLWSGIRRFDVSSGITYTYTEGNAPRIETELESITLSPGQTMGLGTCFCVDASFLMMYDVTLCVADEAVAVVEGGVLKPVGYGVTELIAQATGHPEIELRIPLRVLEEVTGITLPTRLYAACGTTIELTAEVQPEVGYGELMWSVSDSSVAEIHGNRLTVIADAASSQTVTATAWNGVSASVPLRIYVPQVASVKIEEIAPCWGIGDSLQLRAIVQDNIRSYENQLVSFSSSNPEVATVDENGLVSFLMEGTTTLRAAADNGVSDEIALEVRPHTQALALAALPELFVGEEAELRLTETSPESAAQSIAWRSEDAHIATVDSQGRVTAVGAGTVRITVTAWDGFSCETKLVVHAPITAVSIDAPDQPYFILDEIQLTARVTCEAEFVNRFVEWSSSDERIVEVSEDGVATLLSYGEATVTATTVNGLTAQLKLNVRREITDFQLSAGDALEVGETRAVTVANCEPADADMGLSWSSSAPEVVAVDEKGMLTTKATGAARISATSWNLLTRTVDVTVTAPVAASVQLNDKTLSLYMEEQRKVAVKVENRFGVGMPTDGVCFTSSDNTVATVDDVGLVTGVFAGKAVIRAALSEELFDELEVQVSCAGHVPVTDDAVAPTCTQTGLTEGSHCSVCNEVLTAQQTVPATGHTPATDEAVPATHVTTGLTESSHCSVCGEVLVAQQIVPIVEVEKLVLPAKLESIEAEAFAGGTFACVVLPDGCKAIGAGAFKDCAQLRFVEIPTSVTSIDSSAFEGCSDGLIIVTVSGSEAERFADAQGIPCVLR